MKKYVRGGNSAFFNPATGDYRASANGCFRTIVVRQFSGQPVPDKRARFTFAVGNLCETLVADEWRKQGKQLELDVLVEEHLKYDVWLMGHIDAIVDGRIYEEKSVQSVNSFKKIIKGGLYKIENVGQLVHYMLAKEHEEGTLIYTTIGYFGEKSEPGMQREFNVQIKDEKIIINGNEETKFNVLDILHHENMAAELVHNKAIFEQRPITLDPPFESCGSCWLRPMCDKWDEDHNDELFFKSVDSYLDSVGRSC